MKSENANVETGEDESSQRRKKIGEKRKGNIFRSVIRFPLISFEQFK